MSKLPMPFDGPTTYPDHSGVDYPEAPGTTIKASGPGNVTFSGYWNERAAWSTIVDYDNGPLVLYCHQPEKAPRPRVNTRVDLGTAIGIVGSTGIRVTGPHLHAEIMSGEGAHTYDGFFKYFDRNAYVGQATSSGKPAGTKKNKRRAGMNYLRISGKAGERRGGTYVVFAADDGSYVAEFIQDAGPNNLTTVTDENHIKRLQDIIRGLK